MIELVRSSNLVMLSALEATLAAEGIEVFEMDRFISALEGGIGAFPRRMMVADEDADAARIILAEFLNDHPD
jgi:hypothetical protein